MHSSASRATSCAMLTADESNHSAVGTLHLHHSATCILYVILRSPISPSQKKKCAPSLTGDINFRSSHWNNGKMKIAYNFAFQQAVIAYFYIFVLISKKLLCRTPNINALSRLFFANNVGLYINSQQTINTTVDILSLFGSQWFGVFDSDLEVNYVTFGNPDHHHDKVPLQHAMRWDFCV